MPDFEVRYRAGGEVRSAIVTAPDEAAASKAFCESNKIVSMDDIVAVRAVSKPSMPKRGATGVVGRVVSFVGWVIVACGLVVCVWGIDVALTLIQHGHGLDPTTTLSGAAAVVGFQFAVIGLFMAGAGQHFRATTEIASHTAEMLALMKARS